MLMHIRPSLEPLMRLRSAVPFSYHPTLEILLGTFALPLDQPVCATAVTALTECLVDYGRTIPHIRPAFQTLLEDAQAIACILVAEREVIEGNPPAGQMAGRIAAFPAWTLLTEIQPEHKPLRIGLGADIALALLDQTQLSERYCGQLRRDAMRYGRPDHGTEREIQDLQEQGFGRGWLPRFNKIDRQVRRRVQMPDPCGPPRPGTANPLNRFELLARLRWRTEYPDPKHRQGSLTHRHLTPAQYRRAAAEIRDRIEHGDPAGVIEAISVLTQLPPDLALSLPLVFDSAPLQFLGVDIEQGALLLDLQCVFPGRGRPSAATAGLFEIADDLLTVPLPHFLATDLRKRMKQFPGAILLGDLVNWVAHNSRASLLENEHCKLVASLARAGKSTGAIAIQAGIERLAASCITWDFSLVGNARMYYSRLSGRDLHEATQTLFDSMGWGKPAMESSQLPSVGSRCVLTTDGARALFGYLAESTQEAWPGRRAKTSTLLAHHAHFTRYTVALVSFCAGLRPLHTYRLPAQELMTGEHNLLTHDKQGHDQMMAQPALLNTVVCEQIRQYIGHCKTLHGRLTTLADPEGLIFADALQLALQGQGSLFLLQSAHSAPKAVGSPEIWGSLPVEWRVPGNVGRHFWQNTLRAHGVSSAGINRFMRHRVLGLENDTSSQVAAPQASLDRLNKVQIEVLRSLCVEAIPGMRKI